MTTADQAPGGPRGRRRSQRAGSFVRRYGILIPFVITFIVLSMISPPFLRLQNLTNILDQQAGIIIVACAGTLVLIAGGIDLSIGAIYALAGRDRAEHGARRLGSPRASRPASRSAWRSAS